MVPKGLLTFLGLFLFCFLYAIPEFSPCWALPEYIRALIHLAGLRVFSVLTWVIVYRLYRVRWQGQSDVFKRSHWIHLGWWSTGYPKLELFQLSQHSHVTICRLISSSAYFPWNMTLKYKMQLSEGSWDKILHSESRTRCFSKEDFFSGGLSLEAIHQSSRSSFRDFFVKTAKES